MKYCLIGMASVLMQWMLLKSLAVGLRCAGFNSKK